MRYRALFQCRRLAVDADLYCKEMNIDDLIEDAKEFLKKVRMKKYGG